MYSNIQDCDEVYNFWEPLHFLDRGYGFQTWEVSPRYAIRSWAYIALHFPFARWPIHLLSLDKRQSFFAVRALYAFIGSWCEAKFYRAIVETIHVRVGRYTLFMLLFNAGMWNASTAFLPSTFAMHANVLAFSYAFRRADASTPRRTLIATVSFATGAIVGWPFALLVAVPFVVEELFFASGADAANKFIGRLMHLVKAGATSSLLFVPVILIDSYAYGRFVVVPWNIVKYNLFGGSDRGPDLYGSEPYHFYILNLILNFNIVLPLALVSLPALWVSLRVDSKRIASGGSILLLFRLLPAYVWLGTLTTQAHKEERFMYPIYPLLCFNAAVTLYLLRGWMEKAYISLTKSPYRAGRSKLFSNFTFSVVVLTTLVSISRILALGYYYHAPMDIAYHFEYTELPRLLNTTGLLAFSTAQRYTQADEDPRIDLSPLKSLNPPVRLCLAKEWYRFPSHFLIPDGVEVHFVKSMFDGMLPRHFGVPGGAVGSLETTRYVPDDLNDLNEEYMGRYVPLSTCAYLIDLQLATNSGLPSEKEPSYALDTTHWDRVVCLPFLDATSSSRITRTLWLPLPAWSAGNKFGEYCLLRSKDLEKKRVEKATYDYSSQNETRGEYFL